MWKVSKQTLFIKQGFPAWNFPLWNNSGHENTCLNQVISLNHIFVSMSSFVHFGLVDRCGNLCSAFFVSSVNSNDTYFLEWCRNRFWVILRLTLVASTPGGQLQWSFSQRSKNRFNRSLASVTRVTLSGISTFDLLVHSCVLRQFVCLWCCITPQRFDSYWRCMLECRWLGGNSVFGLLVFISFVSGFQFVSFRFHSFTITKSALTNWLNASNFVSRNAHVCNWSKYEVDIRFYFLMLNQIMPSFDQP